MINLQHLKKLPQKFEDDKSAIDFIIQLIEAAPLDKEHRDTANLAINYLVLTAKLSLFSVVKKELEKNKGVKKDDSEMTVSLLAEDLQAIVAQALASNIPIEKLVQLATNGN
jgi:hypothetical protein